MFKLQVGESVFYSKTKLTLYPQTDYTIVADFDINLPKKSFIPSSLKDSLINNWRYHVHVPPLKVDRMTLKKRVIGGKLLAYQYIDTISILGNDARYIGLLPVKNESDLDIDSHKICFISSPKIWLRKLYVHLKLFSSCDCNEKSCVRCTYINRDMQPVTVCIQQINWGNIYVFMNELDENAVEFIKEPRFCQICANCFKCNKSVTYCRVHKRCKHKVKTLLDLNRLMSAKFKNCSNLKI